MKRTRWLLLGAVAALIAWMWWASRPEASTFDDGAAANSGVEVASVGPRNAGENGGVRELDQVAGQQALDPLAPRLLHLELLRFPDRAPLANTQVEIKPVVGASESNWLVTDSNGRLDVEVAAGTTKLNLHAAGYESRAMLLESAVADVRVVLMPTSGLFGRVVDRKHRPVAGAHVRLEATQHSVAGTRRATRSRSEVRVLVYRSVVANATTNAEGFYFLPYATTASAERVRVFAQLSIAVGALDVELPRATTQLDDIDLSTQRALTIRVVDGEGLPFVGALVSSPENPHRPRDANLWEPDGMTTGNDGVVKWLAPALPSSFVANAAGMRQREQRFDERGVDANAKVESLETRIELVLENAPSVRVKVLDAETRRPIAFTSMHVDFLRDSRVVASEDVRLGARAEASVLLDRRKTDEGVASDFDVARLSTWANNYRRDPPTDIDLHAPLRTEPLEFLLEPNPGTAVFRGRVVRGSEPVAGMQVGVRVQRRSEGSQPRDYQYVRDLTDNDGHFVVRWPRQGNDEALTAFPHWFRWDEFGFIGPLDVDVAIASEQVLELKPAVRVPALLRGVSKAGPYCYYVAVVDGDVAASTTINGAPIAVDSDGEARVTLLVPSDRPSKVWVGRNDNAEMANALEFDPAHPGPPLVFEMQPFYANITGRVVGFSDDEIARLSVAFARSKAEGANTVRCAADATFRINGLTHGTGDLLLLIDGESPTKATLLARTALTLRGNLDDVQLERNPRSLPEEVRNDR